MKVNIPDECLVIPCRLDREPLSSPPLRLNDNFSRPAVCDTKLPARPTWVMALDLRLDNEAEDESDNKRGFATEQQHSAYNRKNGR